MPVFVLFVFSAVILGAGAMLSPAWPTKQPRIGLAATFALAIIVGGTVFYASLFGWDTLVIDYLMFALVVGIFLGGTLSVGQARAEKRGEELDDSDQGWTGPQDLAFFLMIGVCFALPVLLFPTPPGDKGQLYGYLALATRFGGTFDTLAPFHPEIFYFQSPGFSALTGYLSQQLNQDIATVQFSVGAVLALVNVWLAYDLGAELHDKRLGRAMGLAMLLSLGLLGALLESDFATLMALTFVQAFLIFLVRYTHHHYAIDAIAAGLMLGAVAVSQSGMLVMALLGYIPWMATMWLGSPRPSMRVWLVMALGIPLVTLASIAPWLANITDLLRTITFTTFERSPENMLLMISYHGVWIVPAAVLGAWLGWQRRDQITILAVGWLLLLVDFSTTGGITGLIPALTRVAVPADVARFGPIIPYTLLGGAGLLWVWDMFIVPRNRYLSYRQTYVLSAVVITIVIALATQFQGSVRSLARLLPYLPDTYATEADFEAMTWIRDNTEPDARILNFPGPYEGDWAAPITERDSVYFPLPAHMISAGNALEEQDQLRDFWENPAANASLLLETGINYVLLPQIIGNPASLEIAWRWDDPAVWGISMRSRLSDVPLLQEVYAVDGAAVYAVILPDAESPGDVTP